MYNPNICSDSDCEWLELYNPTNQTINLTNYQLDNNYLTDIEIQANEYIILARDLNDENNNNQSFYHFYNQTQQNNSTNTISTIKAYQFQLSLTNSEDQVTLTSTQTDTQNNSTNTPSNTSETIITYTYIFEYSSNLGANGNDYSLELNQNNGITESKQIYGTPGEKNSNYQISTTYENLKITELYPDPEGEDENEKPFGEWIELQNQDTNQIDINSLYFQDNAENKLYISQSTLNQESTIINPQEYITIYRNGHSTFSLNNNGYEQISLYHKDTTIEEEQDQITLIDQVSYSQTTEKMSWSIIDDILQLTTPTPNEENYYEPYCDWQIDIQTNSQITTKEDLEFNITTSRNQGEQAQITVIGQITNFYGELIKEYTPLTNETITTTSTKTYSPNLDEGIYQIDFQITNQSCQDTISTNNQASTLIAINPDLKQFQNHLEIEEIYDLGTDNEVKWGEQFRVKTNIYKANETKQTIELYAILNNETVSERTKLNIYEEYQNYTLTLPIELDPNCNEDYPTTDQIEIILEGLDQEAKTTINVNGIQEETCLNYEDYYEEDQDNNGNTNGIEEYQINKLEYIQTTGQAFTFDLQILTDNDPHQYQVWAYVYSGSSCKSCENNTKDRNNTIKTLNINANSVETATFLIKLDENINEKDYKLKIKVLKDDRKTEDELTEEIYIQEQNTQTDSTTLTTEKQDSNDQDSNSLFSSTRKINENIFQEYKEGFIAYQSTSKKAYKLTPILMIIALAITITIILKKT